MSFAFTFIVKIIGNPLSKLKFLKKGV